MVTNTRENLGTNDIREGPIAIAVDRDKTSCQALKWAVDNYIPRGATVKLVHVQRSAVNSNVPIIDNESERQQGDKRSNSFLPMRCLCMRKNIQSEVVFLEDQDVPRALIEYISQNCISTFVIGASLKKSITRLFKADDIHSNVLRWAPDFCTVLVVSKGRLSTVRSATRPLPQSLPSPSGTGPLPIGDTINNEAPSEMSLSREDDDFFEDFSSFDAESTVNTSDRISTDSSALSFYEKLGAPPMLEIPTYSGLDDEKFDYSVYLRSPAEEKNCTVASRLPPTDDSGKKSLKKELKETMNMYHSACKEALMAKEKVSELQIWKMKAKKRIQVAEETAKTAMEKIEMEVQRRVEAEMKTAREWFQVAEKTAKLAMDKIEMEVQRRVKAKMKTAREIQSDDRKMVLDDAHGESSNVGVEYKSLFHILLLLFLFCFYFILKSNLS